MSFLEDPGVPIPAEVTHITGFDRRMIERRLPRFAEVPWACSLREVPWQEFGADGAKLDYLLFRICGEFHDGHRAVGDCLAGIHLLAESRCDGRSAVSYGPIRHCA